MRGFKIGDRVVRSKGDYVVGRTGTIVDTYEESGRVQVQWDKENKTKVSVNSIELESIPYEIIKGKGYNELTGKITYPKYRKL